MDAIFAATKALPSNGGAFTLINNAASVGDLSKTVEQLGDDIATVKAYFDFNVTSCMALTSRFLACCKELAASKITVVNVSSLLTVQAFPGWGLYAPANTESRITSEPRDAAEPTNTFSTTSTQQRSEALGGLIHTLFN